MRMLEPKVHVGFVLLFVAMFDVVSHVCCGYGACCPVGAC